MTADATIGIIGAMESEVSRLTSLLKNSDTVDIYDLTFYTGTLGKRKAVIVKSGIGKVNAARCAQLLIDRFTPDAIINTGIAGGTDSSLSVGDIVIGTRLLQHDFDVTAFGHAKGYLCTGNEHDRPTVFRADEKLADALESAAAERFPERRVKRGIIATGDLFVADSGKKRELWELFGASAAEMEGAAIAQTAFFAGIPFAVLRVVSDQADGKAARSFEEFEEETAKLSSDVMESLLNNI